MRRRPSRSGSRHIVLPHMQQDAARDFEERLLGVGADARESRE